MKEQTAQRGHAGAGEYDHLAPLFREMKALHEDDPRREELRELLVTGYLPLAEHIARRFSGKGIAKEDLVQVAAVGLIHAVDRFDPDQGADFLSYAVPTVMGEVRRHFRDTSWPLRVPRRLQELRLSINQANAELSQSLGRSPTVHELSEHLGLPEEQVEEGTPHGRHIGRCRWTRRRSPPRIGRRWPRRSAMRIRRSTWSRTTNRWCRCWRSCRNGNAEFWRCGS
ncbi:hypothetical protein GCM10029992_58640 [Glycomyces albus]